MYSENARRLRPCQGLNKSGRPCRGFACWGDTRCHRHGGRRVVAKQPVCRCVAYAWPHRPGGGLCRWPDPPLYRRATPAGTHSDYRQTRGALHDAMSAIFGPGRPPSLERHWYGRDAFGCYPDDGDE